MLPLREKTMSGHLSVLAICAAGCAGLEHVGRSAVHRRRAQAARCRPLPYAR